MQMTCIDPALVSELFAVELHVYLEFDQNGATQRFRTKFEKVFAIWTLFCTMTIKLSSIKFLNMLW